MIASAYHVEVEMGITDLFVSCVLSMQCKPPSRHHRKHMGSQWDSPDKEYGSSHSLSFGYDGASRNILRLALVIV